MFVPGRGGMAFPLRYVLNLTGISNCKFIVFCLSIHILVVYLLQKNKLTEYIMEQFSDLIKNRRSMRKFTDEELTQEEVVALMKLR